MPTEKSGFIPVDELMPRVTIEDVARHYGVVLPELKRVGAETRSACFLNCGKTRETGDRALAIQCDDPLKKWHCHQYGCSGKGGNLLSLMDLLKPGENAGGRPRGQRFKELAADLQAIASGERPPETPRTEAAPPRPEPPKVNVPLAESENERARGLTELHLRFTTDIATMPPRASSYLRRRAFLTPEVCQKWRMGYLPRGEKGEDRSGGTMRGRVVFPYLSQQGEVLTWFGRDPDYEDKHKSWEASDRSESEPTKFHFVKGFHRGIELFGQHRIASSEARESFAKLGVVTVEGPNDVIRLDTLGVTALGLCSNSITREQAAKLAAIARNHGNGTVTVMLDCDPEGENGMKQCLGYLAQLCPVRLAWTSRMYGGKFKSYQPENLSSEQWQEIEAYLLSGVANGWSLS
jgi:5S rRNA maturation endonuclease (ribonuclease M5)